MSKKRPRAGVEVSGKKTPNTEKSPDSFYSQKPVWAFIRAVQDEQSEWTISCSKFIRDVIPKLKSWESMTWRDIFKQTHDDSKSSNHFINKSDLTDEGLKNLPNYYDDECLFSLRINNKEALLVSVGINKTEEFEANRVVTAYTKKWKKLISQIRNGRLVHYK